MASPADMSALSSSGKEALLAALLARIAGLVARVEALQAENAALKAENAVLRTKLETPPRTPDNSSMPPSQGQKANAETKAKPKGKPHAGVHRPLHPNPTTRRDVFADRCPHRRAAVAAASQVPLQAYDRIEIPRITPDVTRVTPHGGACPCCHGRFKAAPPAGLAPGSPLGPNLRAFVLYLRFGQAIPFARLERLLLDLFGLAISEGALANMLKDSAPAFEVQASAIRHRLLSGTVVQSDETAVRVGHRSTLRYSLLPTTRPSSVAWGFELRQMNTARLNTTPMARPGSTPISKVARKVTARVAPSLRRRRNVSTASRTSTRPSTATTTMAASTTLGR